MSFEELLAWIGKLAIFVLVVSWLRMVAKPRKTAAPNEHPEEYFDEIGETSPQIGLNRSEGVIQLSTDRKLSRISVQNVTAVEIRQNGQLVAAVSSTGDTKLVEFPSLAIGPNGFMEAGSNRGLLMAPIERLDLILFTSRPVCGEAVTFWERYPEDLLSEEEQQAYLREAGKDILRWFVILSELIDSDRARRSLETQVA